MIGHSNSKKINIDFSNILKWFYIGGHFDSNVILSDRKRIKISYFSSIPSSVTSECKMAAIDVFYWNCFSSKILNGFYLEIQSDETLLPFYFF